MLDDGRVCLKVLNACTKNPKNNSTSKIQNSTSPKCNVSFNRDVTFTNPLVMKKYSPVKLIACLLPALFIVFSGCVKDHCKREHPYSFFVPVYKTKDEVRNNIKSNAPKPVEHPGKIYILGNTIFLNEIDKGIHVIDNADPSNPRNIAFIDVPGNLDIAVKGTTLYADLYTDLVAIDISTPSNVKLKKVIENQFPHRAWAGGYVQDQSQVIVEWVKKDTVMIEDCDNPGFGPVFLDAGGIFLSASSGALSQSGSPSKSVGTGGSMARFTIVNDRLYTVNQNDMGVFNISTPNNPLQTNLIGISNAAMIETIFPFKNKLFIGSQAGMFIYDISNVDAPTATGQFNHVRSCDPVVADDNYAYVTLRSGTTCMGFNNQLDIVNITNMASPSLAKTYQMTNPHGLSKSGNLLFICDGSAGLKLYNVSDVMNMQLIKTVTGINAYDVIAWNNHALVVAKDGLYQYDYTNPAAIRQVSKIAVTGN
jgi:hypothetical protein